MGLNFENLYGRNTIGFTGLNCLGQVSLLSRFDFRSDLSQWRRYAKIPSMMQWVGTGQKVTQHSHH
jgi:hypothetical protein